MNSLIPVTSCHPLWSGSGRAPADASAATGITQAVLRGARHACRPLPKLIISCLFLLTWIGGSAAASQEGTSTAAVAPASPAATHEYAEVTLDGVMLFRVRGITAYPAEQRARDIGERIRAIAADPSVPADSVRVVEAADRSNIVAGERPLMGVFDADAAPEGISRQTLAGAFRLRVAAAIAAYRSDRSPDVLLVHTLYALGATLATAVLLFALRRAHRWLDAMATRRLAGRIEGLEKESIQLVRASQLWKALHGAFKALRVLLALVILYVYLNFVLGLYPWTRPAAQGLFDLIMDPLRAMGSALISEIPNLVFLALLVVVTRYVLKLARLFFAGIEQGRMRVSGIDSELAEPTYRIVRLLIIVFAVVVAYPYIPGSESNAFKGISIFLGLVFSLGSTSVIGNVLAGYTMIYRRAYKIGDRIQIGEVTGDVLERRILVTRLRSVKNEEIVIPNSEILNSNIINFSTLAKDHGLILHTTVGIGYETPWRQVEAMLRMAAERTPGLLTTPEPFVLQKALGDFSVTYELNVYCDQPQAMGRIYTALHQNILDVFNEYGVQIMTPAYEGDTEQPKVVPKARWFEAPAERPPEL